MSEEVNAGGKVPGKGLGVAGMVVGIVGVVFSIWSGGFILGLVGLALSVAGFMQAKKAGAKNNMAMVGIVLSLIAIILSWVMYFVIMNAAEDMTNQGFQDLMEEIENSNH